MCLPDKRPTGAFGFLVWLEIPDIMHVQGTAKNKAEAASFAAYQAIINLFPGAEAPLLGYLKDTTPSFSNDMLTCTDTSVAACLGNSAAFAVLSARKDDKSNQEGNYRCPSLAESPSLPCLRLCEHAWWRAHLGSWIAHQRH